MQVAVKLRNKNTVWSSLLKPRVGDTVTSGSASYANVSGYNGPISDTTVWIPISSSGGSSATEIDKTAVDITGSDPFFSIDLSADVVSAFPSSFSVYKDPAGDDNWASVSPVDYDPVNKILRGMDNPADFPDEKIKILVN